ncbi:hypothetical protein [Undibacterium oligocarboniphilum]|uniref:Uncharacterized protein n=1 Tax=Undibacterium oligocarboniphilum TaxID=666702 RepID=A0A850QBT3_9BURK|nr:hypothetical protein [Undibacterium oligocarboniphilum]MBC3869463.1 hypothetical protein [Undibacterium oligocarboniphilum]NVO77842.1 hypothetical protein [Undibacterium oligocarboniphilum]
MRCQIEDGFLTFYIWGVTVLSSLLKQVLLDEMYFDALAVGIPELFFEDYDEELDHDCHEFDRLDLVDLPLTDDQGRAIDDFFARLMTAKFKQTCL